jgi:hypothetical protein
MGTEVAVARERLTERELQILDHLEQAQSLDVPLTEYASAYNLDVKDLYAGKAQLVKKGLLPSRTSTPERADFVPVRLSSSRSASLCRLTHPSGWVIQSCCVTMACTSNSCLTARTPSGDKIRPGLPISSSKLRFRPSLTSKTQSWRSMLKTR